MADTTDRSTIQDALGKGNGILRLEPAWVPRSFMHPGRRLRLHPDDLYAFGGHRGGINERWFSSTTNADNGPGTPADEGLSYVRTANGKRKPYEIRTELQHLMMDHVSVFRTADGIQQAIDTVRELKRQYQTDLTIDDRGQRFNTDLLEE